MDTVETEDEPDPWDVRINNTGCAVENSRLTDCFYETRDWRKCTTEMMNFQNCWKKNNNDAVSRNTPTHIDWTTSYYGLATEPFSKEVTAILTRTVDPKLDVEMKPDGIIYMPEVRYRRILNEAFGPGGWGLVPRGDTVVGDKIVTREYALVVHGRFISQAQGENNFFSVDQIPRAVEGCKSNALMRCCKDLGIAWQLWDPQFIRRYQTTQAEQVWVEHVVNKKKARIWIKKGDPVPYPYKKTA
ncbi:Mitochondrial genome maintenance protein MGM101 [Ceratocystis platani]|uniref:Mitochondrial genome maintenance protein MGM101 n=1 Tax=Ceratocystis fimbriata f. sp. platani TaxID=88771 RepID=A0A0F8AZX8_CERFI|nr:Mitochondrial genome maintenance protein MGM101 [Ceratocystis platani]